MLHIISSIDPRRGGPTSSLAGLAAAQVKCGMRISLLATCGADEAMDVAETLRADGVNVSTIGPTHGRLSRAKRLSRIVDDAVGGADIIHIHGVWEEIQHQAARLARRRAIPYLIEPCGMLTPWAMDQGGRLMKRLYMAWRMSKHLNGAAAVHYSTCKERDQCRHAWRRSQIHPGRMPQSPDIVEPIGLDLAEFDNLPAPGTFRRRYGLEDVPLIAFLGRIHPGKGLEYIVPALAHVEAIAGRQPTLLIGGPDSNNYCAHIRSRIDELGLQARVVFAGMLRGAERIAMLADADIFCLPSDHENFGVVVIEALAAGTPVVLSEHVGIEQQVVSAGVGSVVKQDAIRLGAELTRWLSNEPLRRAASVKARLWVREHFDWGKIAPRWREHYGRITARSLVKAL